MIGTAQTEAYRRDGFLVVDDVFGPDEVRQIADAVDRISQDEPGIELEPGAAGETRRIRRIAKPSQRNETLARYLRDDRVIAIATALLGPDLRALSGKVNMKPARIGSPVEFHQDWAFYPHTNDDMLTMSIFIDDITEDNGPLVVIPGSHNGPLYDHRDGGRFAGVIPAREIRRQANSLVAMTGKAGAVGFHHVRLVHGSPPNRSDRDRRMLVCPIVAADAWPLAAYNTPLEAMFGEVVAGRPSLTPRLEKIPVRMPYPVNSRSSLFEQQATASDRYYV